MPTRLKRIEPIFWTQSDWSGSAWNLPNLTTDQVNCFFFMQISNPAALGKDRCCCMYNRGMLNNKRIIRKHGAPYGWIQVVLISQFYDQNFIILGESFWESMWNIYEISVYKFIIPNIDDNCKSLKLHHTGSIWTKSSTTPTNFLDNPLMQVWYVSIHN